ncbi:MAG: hypothetical protein AB1435_10690 [Chloroflexota bacterium]
MSKRIIGSAVVVVAVVVLVVLALGIGVGTSEAQGSGGWRGGRSGELRGGQYANPATGAFGQNQAMNQRQTQNLMFDLPPAVPGELPASVVDAITAGIQDEYHAYATYQVIIDQFGAVRPFTSIQAAEAKHIEALSFIFTRYGLPVPESQPLVEVPQFATVTEACAAGAQAEIANAALYDEWLAVVQDYPDITQVFTALRDASQTQHLPAFQSCAG